MLQADSFIKMLLNLSVTGDSCRSNRRVKKILKSNQNSEFFIAGTSVNLANCFTAADGSHLWSRGKGGGDSIFNYSASNKNKIPTLTDLEKADWLAVSAFDTSDLPNNKASMQLMKIGEMSEFTNFCSLPVTIFLGKASTWQQVDLYF